MLKTLVTVLFATMIVCVGLIVVGSTFSGIVESEKFGSIYKSLKKRETTAQITIVPAGEGLYLTITRPSNYVSGVEMKASVVCQQYELLTERVLLLLERMDQQDDKENSAKANLFISY